MSVNDGIGGKKLLGEMEIERRKEGRKEGAADSSAQHAACWAPDQPFEQSQPWAAPELHSLHLASGMVGSMKQIQMQIPHVDERQARILAGVAAAGVVGSLALYVSRRQRRLAVPQTGRFPAGSLPANSYDAVIVGGGPSGSTCAFYLSRNGAKVPEMCFFTYECDV